MLVCYRTSIATVEKDVTKTLNKLDNIAADEANLEAKIQKRKVSHEIVIFKAFDSKLLTLLISLGVTSTVKQRYKSFILAQRRSPFHLLALEATLIETFNPALCRQKEFVYGLKIVLL